MLTLELFRLEPTKPPHVEFNLRPTKDIRTEFEAARWAKRLRYALRQFIPHY